MPYVCGTCCRRAANRRFLGAGLEIDTKPAYLAHHAFAAFQGERQTMANPLQFLQQVRSETAKVVWPNRREVMLTTVMVFIMAALTSVFFFLVDFVIRTGLTAIIG